MVSSLSLVSRVMVWVCRWLLVSMVVVWLVDDIGFCYCEEGEYE